MESADSFTEFPVVRTGVDPVTPRFSGRISCHLASLAPDGKHTNVQFKVQNVRSPFVNAAPRCALLRIHKGTPRTRNLTEVKYVTRITAPLPPSQGNQAGLEGRHVAPRSPATGGAPKSPCVNGQARQIDSRNSAPAAVTVTLSMMSITGATSNSSHVENFAGASARLAGLSVSMTA